MGLSRKTKKAKKLQRQRREKRDILKAEVSQYLQKELGSVDIEKNG